MKLQLLILLFVLSAFGANAQVRYSGSKHSTSHGGTYKSGKGRSHKGGTYKNKKTANHYGRHKK